MTQLNKLETFLIGLALTGLSLITWGASTTNPYLTSLGGALFGSCLGSFIGKFAKRNLVDEIKETVRLSLSPGFISDENRIDEFRKKWHVYHVTKIKGKHVWRHSVVDFSKERIPGRLVSKMTHLNTKGKAALYSVEAGIRDSRLVLFSKEPNSDEPTGIYVFPSAGLKFKEYYIGVKFLQTYDEDHCISATLLTDEPIPKAEVEGTISDEGAITLDDIWREGATSTYCIFPRLFVPNITGISQPAIG